jgi:hypothetical protein
VKKGKKKEEKKEEEKETPLAHHADGEKEMIANSFFFTA